MLPFHPPCCLHMGQFWIGVREGMLWVYWLCVAGGLTAFPWFPHPCLMAGQSCTLPSHMTPALASKALHSAGVFHILGIALGTCWCWVLPLLWEAVVTLLAAEELQAEVLWPRPVWPLWELGWTGVFLSICHDPYAWDCLEQLQDECPVLLILEWP